MVMYLVRIDLDVSSPVQIADSASLVSCRDYTSRSKKKYIETGGDSLQRSERRRGATTRRGYTPTEPFGPPENPLHHHHQHIIFLTTFELAAGLDFCLKFCWYHVMCIKPQTNTNSMKLQRLARLTGAES